MQKRIISLLCALLLMTSFIVPAWGDAGTQQDTLNFKQVNLPQAQWQGQPIFPDWLNYVDDTLAVNNLYSFTGFANQGDIYVTLASQVQSFRLFINQHEVNTTQLIAGNTYQLDISSWTKNGENTVQVSQIIPTTVQKAVKVSIPYPSIINDEAENAGMSTQVLDTLNDFIKSEVKYGFSGAQLAVVKDGNLVANEAYGVKNGYTPAGERVEEGDALYDPVTTDTLYDLASNTKMYSVNYALQYMLTQGTYDISLDDPVTKFYPDFANKDKTIFTQGTTEEEKETITAWKAMLTIRDILKHQAGFTPDPQYHNDHFDQATSKSDPNATNELFSQDRATTLKMVLATPLIYEPGTQTKYSDVDYMLLDFVIEQVTGQRIDAFLKEVFWDPMGLKHVTYNPLENGFNKNDTAATELNGNTRDGVVSFENIRTDTIQGEVHDEKAYYSMDGISGHAGMFSNAEDLAHLAQLMLTGGEGENKYFSKNIMDQFTKAKSVSDPTWGLGWWRQADMGRVSYFTNASESTVGHQGWTGTLTVIDPEENLVIVLLTNRKNSPVIDPQINANDFYSDNLLLGSLGAGVGFVYDSMKDTSSIESVDANVSQMATERIKMIAAHTDAYDEAPHMNDAFALTDLLLKQAEKRTYATNIAYVNTAIENLSNAVVTGVAKDENKANAEQWLAEFNTRKEALTAKEKEPSTSSMVVKTAATVPADENAQRVNYFPSRLNGTTGKISTGSVYQTSSTKFQGYSGQGTLYFSTYSAIPTLEIFVNGHAVDVSAMQNTVGNFWLDVSAYTKTGDNIVLVTGMPIATPNTPDNRTLKVLSINPTVIEGTPKDVNLHEGSLDLLDKLVQNDIDEGFTSAQMAVVKDGKMVYSDAWGKTNSYLQDGTPNVNSPEVTTDTLYDLASNTKMYATNYAIQYLQAHSSAFNNFSINDPITKYFPDFANDTILINYDLAIGKGASTIETAKAWKQELCISDILQHQAGFVPDPQYHNDQYDQVTQSRKQGVENILYAIGKENVQKAICKQPLAYEPGTNTVYSDVDYMLLGLVIEQVTGKDLDTFMKETFYTPMGLTHMTFNPLQHGFTKDDTAATELNGNTRDGVVSFKNIRTDTIQGEVHDEKAYYAMGGVSGHAGLFSNAEDLAKLAQVMLNQNGYGENTFFNANINQYFTSPKDSSATWGMGWWRQADLGRVWYFSVESSRNTIGHQGWTGTLTMIDPTNNLVMVYLTNKINSPVTNPSVNANTFDGNAYTASTLGFASSLLYEGLGINQENSTERQVTLDALTAAMSVDHSRLASAADASHPSIKSLYGMLKTQMDVTELRPTENNITDMKTSISLLDANRDKEMIDELNARLAALIPPEYNKEALQALITKAEGKLESDYTPESWTPFATALQQAKLINEKADTNQQEIDTAVLNLQTALDNLVNKDAILPDAIRLNVVGLKTIKKGSTLPIIVDFSPAHATSNITWSFTKDGVVSVNEDNQLTALSEGMVTVTATTTNGKQAKFAVRVTK